MRMFSNALMTGVDGKELLMKQILITSPRSIG